MMRLARQNPEVHFAHAALGLARTNRLHVITQYLDHNHVAVRGPANPGFRSEVIRVTRTRQLVILTQLFPILQFCTFKIA
jgi:hypothetical protein